MRLIHITVNQTSVSNTSSAAEKFSKTTVTVRFCINIAFFQKSNAVLYLARWNRRDFPSYIPRCQQTDDRDKHLRSAPQLGIHSRSHSLTASFIIQGPSSRSIIKWKKLNPFPSFILFYIFFY